ncbi:MAG: formylglycine-generating enzyme family protein [Chloroflexaceae bacterium]|nr:formylglycine-generating enzyme family protein [Chloroflexaceae bacterium]
MHHSQPPVPTRIVSFLRLFPLMLFALLLTACPSLATEPTPTATELPAPTNPVLPDQAIPEIVEIPAGPFLMGSSADDPMVDDDEQPQHTLELPTYYIGKTEVTNAQFRPFVEGDGYTNPNYWTAPGWTWRERENITAPYYWDWDDAALNGDEQPVVGINWYEAVAYARWLSVQTGHTYRLPTEAEWEKAARGPDGRIWPWGNAWREGLANSEDAGHKVTLPVGSYSDGASPYGVLDMAGNVWELCSSQAYKDYPFSIEDEWSEQYLDQWEEADLIIIRGGGYWASKQRMRGANRSYTLALSRISSDNVGFRLASDSPL